MQRIFVGSDIQKLMVDKLFLRHLVNDKAAAWASIQSADINFLSSHKYSDFKHIVDNLLKKYQRNGAQMFLKLHFLHSHQDFFPKNKNMAKIEKRHQGFWAEL